MFYAVFFPLLFVLLLWGAKSLEWLCDGSWYHLGIYPREFWGLGGIFTSPLIHADLKHLLSNSIPIFLLSWCLCYFYKDLGYLAFLLIWISSGFFTWLLGRPSWHIGASGLIYGLSFFLFFSGVLRRHIPLLAIAMLVVFLYGSTVWNMFPISELLQENVSWEGHLAGAIAGFALAIILRKYGPQKDPIPLEEEEEEEDENTNKDDAEHL